MAKTKDLIGSRTMDIKEIERTILNELSKTEVSIAEFKEMTKPVAPDVAIGRITRMDAINNKSVAEAGLRLAEQKLKNLHRVLSQLGSKDFGLCLKCNQPIPLGRILIRPQSLLCVKCAE
jgi:DnaK suppressor protein